jgi:hypothetical protein
MELQAVPTALRKIASMVLFKHGKNLWDQCVLSQGDYLEGDGSQKCNKLSQLTN